MITTQQVRELAEEKVKGTDSFIVDVAVKPGNKIVVLVDNDNGVTIDHCVAVSRHIEFSLDREKEDFELSVSSPGADQPFKVERQYKKSIGKEVEIVKVDGVKLKGQLLDADSDKVVIEQVLKLTKEEKKAKKEPVEEVTVKIKDIKTIRAIISFKL
jgi:ribosome maturation factor RimP